MVTRSGLKKGKSDCYSLDSVTLAELGSSKKRPPLHNTRWHREVGEKQKAAMAIYNITHEGLANDR